MVSKNMNQFSFIYCEKKTFFVYNLTILLILDILGNYSA